VFGISFLVFGNTATNSVAFAVASMQAAGVTSTAAKIVGIAIAVNTFSCLLHAMSRKYGIWLNNLLGTLKMLMLVLMVIIGFVFLDRTVSDANFNTETSFSRTERTPTGVYRYAEALIYVVFPFGGFHQANYVSQSCSGNRVIADLEKQVLAEIRDPRRNFAWTSGLGVCLICLLFMVINVLYVSTS
jgi:amino acid transporter